MHDLSDIADWLQSHAIHHESAVHVDAIRFPAVPVGQARLGA